MTKRTGRIARWVAAIAAGGVLAAGFGVPAHAAGTAPYYVRVDERCGGAMIDPEWVITTKQCAPAGSAGGLSLVAGWNGGGGTTLQGVTTHHAPLGDVALVQVKRHPAVATIPLSQQVLTDGGRFVVSKGSSGQIVQAEFEVDSPAYAYDYLARSRTGTPICDADAGGPAVVRTAAGDRLAALIRFSYNPCGAFATAAFSKLGATATWNWMMSTITRLDPAGTYVIVNKNSGKALDVNSAGEIIQSRRADTGRQKWTLSADSRETPSPHDFPVTVTNVASRQLLGVVAGETGDGARAVEYPEVGAADQAWSFVPAADGLYTIVNNNSGKVLGVPAGSRAEGENAVQWTGLGVADQLWQVVRVG